jgi:hypothetical protein
MSKATITSNRSLWGLGAKRANVSWWHAMVSLLVAAGGTECDCRSDARQQGQAEWGAVPRKGFEGGSSEGAFA